MSDIRITVSQQGAEPTAAALQGVARSAGAVAASTGPALEQRVGGLTQALEGVRLAATGGVSAMFGVGRAAAGLTTAFAAAPAIGPWLLAAGAIASIGSVLWDVVRPSREAAAATDELARAQQALRDAVRQGWSQQLRAELQEIAEASKRAEQQMAALDRQVRAVAEHQRRLDDIALGLDPDLTPEQRAAERARRAAMRPAEDAQAVLDLAANRTSQAGTTVRAAEAAAAERAALAAQRARELQAERDREVLTRTELRDAQAASAAIGAAVTQRVRAALAAAGVDVDSEAGSTAVAAQAMADPEVQAARRRVLEAEEARRAITSTEGQQQRTQRLAELERSALVARENAAKAEEAAAAARAVLAEAQRAEAEAQMALLRRTAEAEAQIGAGEAERRRQAALADVEAALARGGAWDPAAGRTMAPADAAAMRQAWRGTIDAARGAAAALQDGIDAGEVEALRAALEQLQEAVGGSGTLAAVVGQLEQVVEEQRALRARVDNLRVR